MSSHETPILVGMLITLSAVALFELRYLRSKRKRLEAETELPDRAHNAILTTKAIRETIARGGVHSVEADGLIREAEGAMREHHFRVVIELTEKAKGVLRSAKLKHARGGDLAKLEDVAAKPGKGNGDATTEKERLMKELPPNYMQAKFSMDLARDDIAAAKARGQGTQEAEQILANAQVLFDKQEYDGALKHAVRARRSLEGTPPEVEEAQPAPAASAQAPAKARTCTSCGAPVSADDTFCRKCGVKVQGPRTCPSCSAVVADEDTFCRECGAKVP